MENKILNEFLSKTGASDTVFDGFYHAVNGGDNGIFHNVVSEALTLDDSWVTTLENTLYYVEDIVKNPKKFIADEETIVEVERAKRTNSKTMRHLAGNTRNISRIDDDGSVVPKKVLATEMIEELGIYENRFVCALINRIAFFIEKRRQEINEKMRVYDISNITMNSDFHHGDAMFNYRMEISVKEPPHDTEKYQKNQELADRVERLRYKVQLLKNTDFMKKLNGLKPVRSPIMKTNMLKMNVNYNNCYKLWLYLSSYSLTGYSTEIKDKLLPVDGDFYDDLTLLAALSIKTLLANNALSKDRYEEIPFGAVKKRKYKLLKKYNYSPSYKKDRGKLSDDLINEYYYEQMKKAVTEVSKVNDDYTYVEEKDLQLSFGRFFRSVGQINDSMFLEVIKAQAGKSSGKMTALQKKEQAYKQQKTIYNRYKLLSKLKADYLEKALKAESREMLKLEKLKTELDKTKERTIKQKEIEKRKREKLKKIKERTKLSKSKAAEYQDELYAKEQEKLERQKEARRKRAEDLRKKKEIKMLEELKRKYEETKRR